VALWLWAFPLEINMTATAAKLASNDFCIGNPPVLRRNLQKIAKDGVPHQELSGNTPASLSSPGWEA